MGGRGRREEAGERMTKEWEGREEERGMKEGRKEGKEKDSSTTHMQPIGLMMIYINNKKRSCWILAMNEVNSTHHQVNHILFCLN